MIGDLLFWGAMIVCTFFALQNINLLPFIVLIMIMGYKSWKNSGSFMAWNKENQIKFLKNAKKFGL